MKSRLFALPVLPTTVALLLTATVAAAPAAVAAPGDPNQVALRVEYPDGTSRQWCVNHTAGMSGAEVLSVAAPKYGTGPYAGFVLKIGDQGTVPPTDQKYWAYWTTTNGALTYSGAGVTATRPAAGTVEAWHWNSTDATEKPSAGSYRSICPGGYEPAIAPAPATTPTTAAGGGSGGGATGNSAPTTSGTTTDGGRDGSTTSPTAATTGETGAGTPGTSATPGATPGATPSTSSSGGTTGGTAGVGRTVDASPVAVATDTGGSGRPLGLALAGVAVVALAAAAVWQRRRRSATDE